MRKLRCILVVLAALAVSLSFAVPVEDDPETPYDESESLPYEGTPLFSIAVPETVVAAPAVWAGVSSLGLDTAARRCESYRQHPAWAVHPISDPLTISNCSLRC
jgi:hypothetical protein